MQTGQRSGVRGLHKTVSWNHMPRIGELVELAPEIEPARVQDVNYDIDGGACVDLGAQDLDTAEVAYLVDDGWVAPTNAGHSSTLDDLHGQVVGAVLRKVRDR